MGSNREIGRSGDLGGWTERVIGALIEVQRALGPLLPPATHARTPKNLPISVFKSLPETIIDTERTRRPFRASFGPTLVTNRKSSALASPPPAPRTHDAGNALGFLIREQALRAPGRRR